MDREHYKKPGKGDEELKEKGISAVEEAHIIPFSYASYDSSDVSLVGSNILHNIEAIPEVTFERWSTLYRCFLIVREIGMTVSKINDVANGLSLHPTVPFRIWRIPKTTVRVILSCTCISSQLHDTNTSII